MLCVYAFHYTKVLTAQPNRLCYKRNEGRLNCCVRSIYPSSISLRTTGFDCTT